MKVLVSASRNFCKLEAEIEVVEVSECKGLLSQMYHVLEDVFPQLTEEDKPSEKQIEYAKRLGIKNPESYTKDSLRSKIAECQKL